MGIDRNTGRVSFCKLVGQEFRELGTHSMLRLGMPIWSLTWERVEDLRS